MAHESESPANWLDGALHALTRGAAVVTASQRAARALRLHHARSQRVAGHRFWPSPPIYDWTSWLRDLWQSYAFATLDAPLLLSPLQERALWGRIQRTDANSLLSPDSAAALAMEAWSLLSAFSAHPARSRSWEPADAEQFRLWAQTFERECAAQGWISLSQLEARLAGAPPAALALPLELCLIGFDRFTPAQTEFLASLRARGVVIAELVPGPRQSLRRWIVAGSPREEFTACAAWARQFLMDRPDSRIGIIAPAVRSSRGEIERAFRRALLPSADDIRRPSSVSPFEFSLGQPLSDVPAVRAALLLLRWTAVPLREEEISWLLLSGFLADTATHHLLLARRDVDRCNTSALVPKCSLSSFRTALNGVFALRPLADRLGALLQTVEANRIPDQPRPPSSWTELVQLLLDQIRWPGERPSDSVQFQALQCWQRLLDDVALLDFDGSVLAFAEFLDLLELHARETIFALESADAPVQILGPLESAGQEFDAIWFLSADDAHWPPPGGPHPLLPLAVQRQFGMPHATSVDPWNLALLVTTRLLRSAPEAIFSYAQHDDDAEFRPSPLLSALFLRDAQLQSAVESFPVSEPLCDARLEIIPDAAVSLPWPTGRSAGGADVLKRQAACPFQSFAANRLRAEPLDTRDWGLEPSDKGKLLHEVLQQFFTHIRSHGELVTAKATHQLDALLDRCIDSVLVPYSSSDPWQRAYIAAEKRRLRFRIDEWLACEVRRLPFTVEATERKLSGVRVGDLLLNLRADRIDLLSDGSRLLIDYKTGRISPAAWSGDRPDEPQLPLYAVCGNVENLSGILLAKIRAGETGFDGRVRDARAQLSGDLSQKKKLVSDPFTDSMRDQWTRALLALAQEFLDGESSVSPRELEVCRNCPLPALCRKAERNLSPADQENEEEPDA